MIQDTEADKQAAIAKALDTFEQQIDQLGTVAELDEWGKKSKASINTLLDKTAKAKLTSYFKQLRAIAEEMEKEAMEDDGPPLPDPVMDDDVPMFNHDINDKHGE